MSGTLRLRGSTSGYSELQAPAVAADQTFVLPTAGGTLLTTDSPVPKLTLELGSASQPSLTFQGDTDTGLFSEGTNTLNLVTGGSSKVVLGAAAHTIYAGTGATVRAIDIDSSGNVGIGTSTGDGKLTVNSSGARAFEIENAGSSDSKTLTINQGNANNGATNTVLDVGASSSNSILTTGNVGIGTTVPRGRLHVGPDLASGATDAARINLKQASTTAADGIYLERSGERRGYSIFIGPPNDGLTFRANNFGTFTTTMYLNREGNVGIGTTSPSRTLTVQGDMNLTSGSSIESDSSGGTLQIQGGSTYPGGNILLGGGSGTDDIRFRTSGASSTSTEAMRIDSSGNVGIGTSSPTDKLSIHTAPNSLVIGAKDTTRGNHVFQLLANNTAGDGEFRLYKNAASGTHGKTVEIKSTGVSYFNGGNVGIGTSSPTRMLEIKNSDNVDTFAGLKITSNNQSAYVHYGWRGLDGSDQLRFATGTTERMRIDSSGNVGIGTTSFPANGTNLKTSDGTIARHILEKTGSNARIFEIGNGGTFLNIYDATADSERLRIDSVGKVGIGCTPVRDLQLHTADASSELMLSNSTTGATAGSGFMIQQDGNDNYIWNKENSFMSFGTNALERMRIDSSGNIGIGTSAPSHPLEVRGVNTQINFAATSTGGGYLMSTSAGQWSIGGGVRYNGAGWYARHTSSSIIRDDGDANLRFFTNTGNTVNAYIAPAERMRIDSSGKLLHGKTSSNIASDGTEIQYGTGGVIVITNSGNGVNNLILNSRYGAGTQYPISFRFSGSEVGYVAVTSSSASFVSSSDYRLKENVVDISDGINRVKQLKPKRFNFIVDTDTTVDGFLAHEAQTVVPEAVTGEKDGERMQGIDQSKLVPLLTAALQEAIAKIETLEQRLSDAGIA